LGRRTHDDDASRQHRSGDDGSYKVFPHGEYQERPNKASDKRKGQKKEQIARLELALG
jgi:hypothetical protein